MIPALHWVDRLTPVQVELVNRLVAGSPHALDEPPLSDQVLLNLTSRQMTHLLVTGWGESDLLGYAQLTGGDPVVAELVTTGDPAIGELIAVGLAGKASRVWAHGQASAAAQLARQAGWQPQRLLLQLRRALPLTFSSPQESPGPARSGPDITIRPFRAGQDEQALLDVNAAAFAGHPEQGRWTRDDLAARTAADWFDPTGLLLAERSARLIGFHWTKVHPARPPFGEVYVLAVDPSAQGSGLGRILLQAGLQHLTERGLSTVALYVEATNEAALRLYRRAGFATFSEDVQYELPEPG